MLFLKAQKKEKNQFTFIYHLYNSIQHILLGALQVCIGSYRWMKDIFTHEKWGQVVGISPDNQQGQYGFLQGLYKIHKNKSQIKNVLSYYNHFINVEFYMLSCTLGQTTIWVLFILFQTLDKWGTCKKTS